MCIFTHVFIYYIVLQKSTYIYIHNIIYTYAVSVTLKLESVLKASARPIGVIPKCDHISTYRLDTLHWLPISKRIEFKILTLMWNWLIGIVPSWLTLYLCLVCSWPLVPSFGWSVPVLVLLQLSTTSNNLLRKTRADLLSLAPSLHRKTLEVYSVWITVLLVGSEALYCWVFPWSWALQSFIYVMEC